MKKNKFFYVLMLLVMAFALNACNKDSKDDDDDDDINQQETCDNLVTAYEEASTAFGNNPTEATCTDWVNSMENLLEGCNTIYSAAQVEQWEDALNSIDCSLY